MEDDDPINPPPPAPPPTLDYRRSNDPGRYRGPMPAPAGFAIGVALFLGVAGVCVLVARLGRFNGDGAICLFACVPIVAAGIAAYLQVEHDWPAVLAGAMTAIGVSALVGCCWLPRILCGF